MLRALTLILILLPIPLYSFERIASYEHSEDFIDADEKKTEFNRYRGELRFDKETSVIFTLLDRDEERSRTWSAKAGKDNFRIMLGDFYPHFSSGLVTGRVSPYSDDPYRAEREMRDYSDFTRCSTGDDRYPLKGGGISYSNGNEYLTFRTSVFASFKRININEEDGCAESSINSTGSDGSYSTSKALQKRGGALVKGTIAGHFSISFVSDYIRIVAPDGSTILSSYNKETGAGVRSVSASSLSLSYHDKRINIFTESAISETDYRGEQSISRCGRGNVSGVKFRSGRAALDFTYRRSGRNFSAPGSAYTQTRDAREANLKGRISIFQDFSISARSSSSSSLDSYGRRNLKKREGLTADLRRGKIRSAISLKHRDDDPESVRIDGRVKWIFLKESYISVKGSRQRGEGRAWMSGCELLIKKGKSVSFVSSAGYISAKGGESFYITPHSYISKGRSGSLSEKSRYFADSALKFRIKSFEFAADGAIFFKEDILEKRFQLSASASF